MRVNARHHPNWARLKVSEYARAYDLIVVMPDAGNSWYANWAGGEDAQKDAWEDCIIKDLIPHVDATYRTVARREGRAINGLSMGGYGALMLGLRHPRTILLGRQPQRGLGLRPVGRRTAALGRGPSEAEKQPKTLGGAGPRDRD